MPNPEKENLITHETARELAAACREGNRKAHAGVHANPGAKEPITRASEAPHVVVIVIDDHPLSSLWGYHTDKDAAQAIAKTFNDAMQQAPADAAPDAHNPLRELVKL